VIDIRKTKYITAIRKNLLKKEKNKMKIIYTALTLVTVMFIIAAMPAAADPGTKVVNVSMGDGVNCGVQGTVKMMPDETVSGDLCWTLSNNCHCVVWIDSVSLESLEFPEDNVAIVSGTFTAGGWLMDFYQASTPFQLSFTITDAPDDNDIVQVYDSTGEPVATIDSSLVSITVK
jgi:hypothetical protein